MAWTLDKNHTHIGFKVKHMMISTVSGEFMEFDGTVNYDPDNVENTTVDLQIPVSSINTRVADRDGHLRSGDFFDAEKYPNITFKSKRAEAGTPGDNRWKIVGDLTIKDVTKEVVLDVETIGTVKDPYGKMAAGFHAISTINRKDWGLNWNVALEAGGWLVGEEVAIDLQVELQEVAEGQPA